MTPNGVFWLTLILVLAGLGLAIGIVAKIIAGGITLATTKVCAACRSRIPNAATKCKFCGSDLTGPAADPGKEQGW